MKWIEFGFVEENSRFEDWCFRGEVDCGLALEITVAASRRQPHEAADVRECLARGLGWVVANHAAVLAFIETSLEEQGLAGCAAQAYLTTLVLHHDERYGDYFTAWFSSLLTRHTPIAFISATDFSFIGEAELYE